MEIHDSIYSAEFSGQQDHSRRSFISKASAAGLILSVGAGSSAFAERHQQGNIKAVAFDAFAIFDPRPVFALTEKIFPGKGKEIVETWRIRQFEYCWIRETAGQYKDFLGITADALLFAARKAQVTLDEAVRNILVNAYLSLETWPDVLPALEFLRKKSIRLGFLSNMTAAMLDSNIRHNGLLEYFEAVLSTDQLKTYKPSPQSYQMAVDAFRLKKSEILFVAFASWDATGSRWFGYPTYWLNRMDAPIEELSVSIEMTGKFLDGIRLLV